MRQHDLFWLDDICCEDVGLRLQGPVVGLAVCMVFAVYVALYAGFGILFFC